MTRPNVFELRLLGLAVLLQLYGAVVVTIWETSRIRQLADIGVTGLVDRNYRWLLASTFFLLIAVIAAYFQGRFRPLSFLSLFLCLMCQLSIYILSVSYRREILSIFSNESDIDGLVRTGTLSKYSIAWSLQTGWEWWFWLWTATLLIGLVLVLEILKKIPAFHRIGSKLDRKNP
jgi:hypothetical protein